MKRGEIYYANLSPAVGSEMAKRRRVLIVSNDINNRAASCVTILLQPKDSGLSKASKVQGQQIRTISKQRISPEVVGSLSEELMQLVDAAVKSHLALD
jgi:mRNA interferase MazF